MIYLDNAATTMQKPPQVVEAVSNALCGFGGVCRGVHGASLAAGMVVYEARDALSRLLGGPGAARVGFTYNVTESLNIAINGLGRRCSHAVTTAASHNSVLRPLKRLKNAGGFDFAVVPIGADGSLDLGAFDAAFTPATGFAVVTHASNLTGDIYDVAAMAEIAHAHDALLVVDAAQTAGCIDIDMGAMGIDVLCVTGHKGLMGPQGTGAILLREGLELDPLKVGGSGNHSFDLDNYSAMPETFEAGTINGHGIAGLGAAVDFVLETGVDAVAAHEHELLLRFEDAVRDIKDLRIFGGEAVGRTAICALNIGSADSGVIADILNNEYGICVRAGAHCAPLMHKALGTAQQGAVRFSFGFYNTIDEVNDAAHALHEIASRL